jgi:acyl-CoA thioesterase II
VSAPAAASDPEVDAVVSLLSPIPVAADRYLAEVHSDDVLVRVYGGQVVAQALAAAGDNAGPAFLPQSLHGYFVRPGQFDQALDIGVERVRDGRSFATRRVTAVQDGKPVFVLNASFHVDEPGEDYQIVAPGDVAEPEAAPSLDNAQARLFAAFDLREPPPSAGGHRSCPRQPARRFWARTRAALPDDPLLHAAVLAYISDFGPVMAAYAPLAAPFLAGVFGSLDHAIWFHRPVRMDEWVLFDYYAISNARSRGLVQGLAYTRTGTLVASFTQEVLIRVGR